MKYKRENFKKVSEKNGMTLLFFVVTTVMLLILVGASLGLVLSGNLIIERAKGERKNITDSSTWENYRNSDGDAKIITEEGTKYGIRQITGYSEYWKANNIYDIAGNCEEWTQEANGTDGRALRGGFYSGSSSIAPASGRYSYYPTYNYGDDIRFSSNFNNYY